MLGIKAVPKSMHNIKMVVNGNGIYTATIISKGRTSAILPIKINILIPQRTKVIVFLRLSNIFLPSSIPITIFEKSSFSKTISAASLATSEPDIPIEIPISALLIAGESFTPSPVTATT